jgi:hypothetical protein
MSDTPDILASLNEAQRSAVTAPDGPTGGRVREIDK